MKAHGQTLAVVAMLIVAAASLTAAASAGGKHRGLKAPKVLAAAVHADLTVIAADGKVTSSSWDKGEVTAISSSSITLKRKDGQSVTLSITSETKTRKRAGKLEAGDDVFAVSKAGAATLILAAGPHQGREGKTTNDRSRGKDHGRGGPPAAKIPRAAVHVDWKLILADGKTVGVALDRGDVSAVSTGSLTIARKDGASVTLLVTSETKILKREHAPLAVGDAAVAWSQDGKALVVAAGDRKEKS